MAVNYGNYCSSSSTTSTYSYNWVPYQTRIPPAPKPIVYHIKTIKPNLEIGSLIQGFLILPDYAKGRYKLPNDCYNTQDYIFKKIAHSEVKAGDYVLIDRTPRFDYLTKKQIVKIQEVNKMNHGYSILKEDICIDLNPDPGYLWFCELKETTVYGRLLTK